MKEWKNEIAENIISKTEDEKIVNLYDVAKSMGYNHIPTADVRDIMNYVLKRVDGYKAVKMVRGTVNESLFTALTFVQADVEFEDAPEEG